MKLVTFQTIEVLKELINKGYIECNPDYINVDKNGSTYNWVSKKMSEKIINNNNAKYPIWCWVKYKSYIYPPKRKGEPIKGYDVKITFNKPESEVFITDFRRYSFLLNNKYIPKNKKDFQDFQKLLEKHNITDEDLKAYIRKDKYETHRMDQPFLDVCEKIRNSFDRCITKESDILQGAVWRINLEDVEGIEMLKNDGYRYGSVNYIRSNGKRFNWIEDFYNKYNIL